MYCEPGYSDTYVAALYASWLLAPTTNVSRSCRNRGRVAKIDVDDTPVELTDRSAANAERPGADEIEEQLAVDVLEGDEVAPVRFADLVDGSDVGVRELGGGERFAQEALAPRRVVAQSFGEDLERDIALEPRIAREVDLAHAPGAQHAGEGVGAQGPGSCGHGGGF